MQTLLSSNLKRLPSSFCFSSKMYQILFCNIQKWWAATCKIEKIRERKLSIACGNRIPSYSLKKGCWLFLELLQIPFVTNCMRNLWIARKADNSRTIQLWELNLKEKMETSFNGLFNIPHFYTHKILSNHTTCRLKQFSAAVPLIMQRLIWTGTTSPQPPFLNGELFLMYGTTCMDFP